MNNGTFTRKWLLTIVAPKKRGWDHDSLKRILKKWKNICFWCMCDEIQKEGVTVHTHLFIVGEVAIPFSEVKKRFPMAHIEECKGSDVEIIAYIRKEGKYKTDKEINIKESFEAAYKKSSIISEVIYLVKRFFRRKDGDQEKGEGWEI